MLVLTRRVDESIAIGDSIVVTILAIEGDRVKVGITAPREVPILRQEVAQAIEEQRKLQEHLAHSPEPETFEELRRLLASDGNEQGKPGEEPAATP
ncbi:MAG TPA: carbon storage regulator [Anaerolinea thermolimosa]|uniref:Translational regulator CsrA n=1 Tax=Anaerolinea thermolimosa TaxID=229919 RepID=A0A3D1JFA8_9CHLR|nr:carbon storage regulator CsrA [Anaerolinea thermolimosa]GAP07897.1 carbon storage regulator, CsrA [Anaerolinea thermolimosa]HCE16286.1 carbon storage regulator [Anaerolinea thermolimosa]